MKELLVRVISKKRSNANRGQRPRVETHSLPTLTRSHPRRFTFHVADPISSVQISQATRLPLQLLISCIVNGLRSKVEKVGGEEHRFCGE